MRTNIVKTLAALASASMLIADNGNIVRGVLSDAMLGICTIFGAITALFWGLYYWGVRRRKTSEATLRETELDAVHILNGARDAIISVNEEGVVENFNPAAEAMFGCPAATAIGRSILDFLPAPERAAKLEAHLQTGTSGRDLTGVKEDGTVFPVDLVMHEVSSDDRLLFSIFVRDISSRKNMESALESERNFSVAVLESAGALVVVMDHEGRIVSFNRACEETTDYRFSEIKNQPPSEFFASPGERDAMRQWILDVIHGEFPSRTENTWRARDMTAHRISWSHTALRDRFGGLEHVPRK